MRKLIMVFATIMTCVACGHQEKQGDFIYECTGGGWLDGASCEAPVTPRFFLWKTEFAEPHEVALLYSSGRSDFAGASALPYGSAYVSEIGIDHTILVVKTNDQKWYVFDLQAVGWPNPKGPLDFEEFKDMLPDQNMPEMKAAW